LLIIFTYIASISSNEIIKIKKSFFLRLFLLLPLLFLIDRRIKNSCVNYKPYINFDEISFTVNIFISLYLLITLISTIIIAKPKIYFYDKKNFFKYK